MDTQQILSRLRGVFYASVVGDALGASVEFESWQAQPVTDMAANPHFQAPNVAVPAGSFTDDTSLSLALLDALLAHSPAQLQAGQLDTALALDRMCAWAFDGHYSAVPAAGAFDIGLQTERVLRTWRTHGQPPANMPQALGNGAIVRVHVCLLMADDFAPTAPPEWLHTLNQQQVALTHPNAVQYAQARLTLQLLWALLRTPSPAAKADVLRAVVPPAVLAHALAADYRNISGHVTQTLHGALAALAQTDSLEACLVQAASYYGDSDSVCALAGALAGALYGFEAIPTRWLASLQNQSLLSDCWARIAARHAA